MFGIDVVGELAPVHFQSLWVRFPEACFEQVQGHLPSDTP
jgi:hypothetical protein